jgi:hypothetical protein
VYTARSNSPTVQALHFTAVAKILRKFRQGVVPGRGARFPFGSRLDVVGTMRLLVVFKSATVYSQALQVFGVGLILWEP